MDSLIILASTIFASVLGAIIARELFDNAPRISRWFIGRAASRLPEKIRDRYREEWKAHADELPSLLGKLFHGMGCWLFARKVAREARKPAEVDASQVAILTYIVHFLFYSLLFKSVAALVRRGEFKQAAREIIVLRSYHYFVWQVSGILAESAIKNRSRPGGFEREMNQFKARLEAIVLWEKNDPEGYKHFMAELAKKEKPNAI